MLKKSLKAGSILVLLFSLLFFIGCSNGTTDTEPDTNTPPVIDPPDTPVVVEPRVTRVTIVEKDVEVGRGESRFFTAQVEGVGDFDSTVTWQVLPAEAGEESPLNSIITSKGKLTLDGGLHIGQDVWIQATAGTIRDTARVIVAPEGPYFTWEPGKIKREANQDIVVNEVFGYLRGYSYREKDIRLRVGILEENVDFVIGTENGVHGVGGDTVANALILRGESTPYEGVSVLLDTGRITLDDPTKTGIIRITMLPGAFFGSNVAELNPGRTSLVIEVSDHRAIDELVNLDMAFTGADVMPIQGKAVPRGVQTAGNTVLTGIAHSGTPTALSYISVEWSHLSLAGNFEKQADADVVASVTLRPQGDTYFLKNFETNPSAISNANAFINGSPAVSNVSVSVDGKTLTFNLTYKVFARILKTSTLEVNFDNDKDIGLYQALGSSPTYGFTNFAVTMPPEHKDPLPPLKWTANSYFDAKFEWDANSAGVDADAGTFRAARLPQENYALGTLTLTPKVGYTFEGTTFEIAHFNLVFTTGSNPVKTAVLGDGGSLILGFSYLVGEKEITTADIKPENFATLIARPIHGKSVGVRSTFTATDDSPYTGTVVWLANTNPARNGRFSTDDSDSSATITLKAKTGYKFVSGVYTGAVLMAATAVDGPGGGPATAFVNDYEYIVEIVYAASGPGTTEVLQQITSLDGYQYDLIDPVAEEDTPLSFISTVVQDDAFLNTQTVATRILTGTYNPLGTELYEMLTDVRVIYTIEPAVGYTFKADEGTYAYFAVDDLEGTSNGKTAAQKAAYIAEYFSKVYNGSVIPVNSRVRVNVNGIYLDVDDNLVLDLTYPKKPAVIDDSMFTDYLELGNLAEAPETDDPIPTTFSVPGSSVNYTTTIEFHVQGDNTPATGLFLVDTIYEAWITVTPKNGYTFVGTGNDPTKLADVDTAVENAAVYGSGTSAGIELGAGVSDISVKGFIVDSDEAVVSGAKDKIIIILTFDQTT